MKKALVCLLAISLLCSALVGGGYSLFVFSGDKTTFDTGYSTSNALFDQTESKEYYRVYFFASPYYATGAEIGTTTLTDPLQIADHPNNPYDLTDPYMLVGLRLTGNNKKFANAHFADGNDHYISYKSKKYDVLTGEYDSFERYQKRDYSGFIRPNEALGIDAQTSTYVMLTVQGNISMEQLSGIVAATVFKDEYGFGPEFIGWTYDKEKTKERTMYGNSRYASGTEGIGTLTVGDTRGWNTGATAYEIGNFGCQGEIEQVTSTTSLKAIDKTTDDGSLAEDKVIYLYPVFAAKNKRKTVAGQATSLIKFRINADTTLDASGIPYYEYRQEYEIDYDKRRYTSGLFQRPLNAEKNNINYYTNNLHIGKDSLQLDVNPLKSGQLYMYSWGTSWTTIMSHEEIRGLGLDEGYYNIDITFVQLESYSGVSYAATINALIDQYKASEQYAAVFSSLSREATGVVALPLDLSNTAEGKKNAYYVVGFQKVEEFRLVGDRLNSSLTDYNASGYYTLNTTSQMGEHVEYIVDKVYLQAGSHLSVLTSYADGKSGAQLPYDILAMQQSWLDAISEDLQVTFTAPRASGTALTISDNQITVDTSGSYTLIFRVEYDNGSPKSISFAFRDNGQKYSFIVLEQKPDATFFTDRDALQSALLMYCEGRINSYLTKDTVLTDVYVKRAAVTTPTTIAGLFASQSGKRMIDTATGAELSYTLFEEGTFCLGRNYVVYFE